MKLRPARIIFIVWIWLAVGSSPAFADWFPPQLRIWTDSGPPRAGEVATLFVSQIQGESVLVAGAEFGLEATELVILDLIPRPGFENLGTVSSPILVPTSDLGLEYDVVLAEVVVRVLDVEGGSLCFRGSDDLGVNCSIVHDSKPRSYVWHFYAGFRWGSAECGLVPDNGVCELPILESPDWGIPKVSSDGWEGG